MCKFTNFVTPGVIYHGTIEKILVDGDNGVEVGCFKRMRELLEP